MLKEEAAKGGAISANTYSNCGVYQGCHPYLVRFPKERHILRV